MKTASSGKSLKKGKLIILVAPSGTGKTTLAKRLLIDFDNLKFSVSATTRPPRNHEVDGKDYLFLSRDDFNKAIEKGDFLEWEEIYGGARYGTLQSTVEKELKKGYFVLLDIEVKGALNVKAKYGNDALAVFIKPPSDEVLMQRLKERGTETDESLKMRQDRARMELAWADRFDHVIVNDDIDRCYKELSDLVNSYMNS